MLYDRPLNEWRQEEGPYGFTQPTDSGLRIVVYGGDGYHTVAGWTERDDFADISASVDVRQISDRAIAIGCIAVRHDASLGEYQLCVTGNGETWATYDWSDENGDWFYEELLPYQLRQGVFDSKQWNRLQIISRGNRLWFLTNGNVLGSVVHDGRTAGSVAIHVSSWDMDIDAEFEFRNLVVRAVQ